MKDKIHRFIDCYVPVTTCTLRCSYCYITQHRLFKKTPVNLKYTPEEVASALSKERLGGPCLINFCAGGETLLVPRLIEYIRALLEEGHYVMIVTNATIDKRIDEFSNFPKELLERLFFKFSYHYLELKERKLLDKFFSNIKKVWEAGASFTLEVTPHDELIPFIDEMNEVAIQHVGAIPHITIARDEYNPQKLPILTKLSNEKFYETWGKNKSEMLEFKKTIYEVPRKEFCYAGAWSFYLNLGSGIMTQCYKSAINQNIFEDINKPIDFTPIGCNCQEHHCYNGHAFLTLGDIPELQTMTYAELRNRKTVFNKEWLSPQMKSFMSSKLVESNVELTSKEKKEINKQIKRKFLVKKSLYRINKAINLFRK